MNASVTVYFNTGFNGIDIPASPAVLANASKRVFNSIIYIREDIDKPTLRLNVAYSDVSAVDYCKISTVDGDRYFFASPTAVTQGVTLLHLDLDALLTMGGASNLTYISGWQERGHISKNDDELFGNIATEDWVPSQPLENKNMQALTVTSTATRDLDIVMSNVDISALGVTNITQDVIEGIAQGTVDPVMYFPMITTVSQSTGFYIYDFADGNERSFTLPNTGAFDPTVLNVKQGIQKLFSCGQLQLQASYQIPKEYVSGSFGVQAGQYTNIHGIHGENLISGIPFEYSISGYTPKNKKVYATYRNIALVNLGSGDMSIKDPAEIYDGSSTAPSVRIWSDVSSTGKPYARFKYIKGNPVQYADCVRGLQWANSQIVLEGASGSVWNSINNAFANQQLQRQQSMNLFNQSVGLQQGRIEANKMAIEAYGSAHQGTIDAIGAMVSPIPMTGGKIPTVDYNTMANRAMGGLRQGASMVQDSAMLQQNLASLQNSMNALESRTSMENQNIQNQINQNSVGLIRSNNVVAPSVYFTPEQNLGLYGYNRFVVYEVRKSDDDLKSEDMYYQRYGYNGLHRPLTQQCFNERQYYCFVQAFDVNLKGAQEFGLRVRSKAIAQLNKGVRVWKVLPDATYYETN